MACERCSRRLGHDPVVLELVPIYPEGSPHQPPGAPVLLGWVCIIGDTVTIDFASPAEAEACAHFHH